MCLGILLPIALVQKTSLALTRVKALLSGFECTDKHLK